ncbi:hypothetical protein MAF45_02795 [Mesosutterella sp. OilRF-GAM-744-9]|uniref:Uncharacterized protein n=2 Tax=Mesosutterella TaxID=2494213 RepID=A0ABS9MP34_9BURK|nr:MULTISPECIES: hypothetical protein [unclassified Mesosutterella]MCG5030378.1 hypothetical protein [Mesosutterella sp. oilRF-744-WT-GAM-9]MDL2059471.1 hypothetical protein [Mesosutterella sp. AGMB02718]
MKKLFFTWSGMGDNLVLLAAAYNYFKLTGEKAIIGTNFKNLTKLCPYVEAIDWFTFNKLNSNEGSKLIEQAMVEDLEPTFITASSYKYLAPSFKNNVTCWPRKHMITTYCERMGLSGEIEIKIPLDFGFPIKNKEDQYICIMTGGLQNYKAIPCEIMQPIIDYFSDKVSFVQLGGKKDRLLKSVKDCRGLDILDSLRLLKNSLFFIGGVGGLIHLAKAANCNSLVLQSTGEPISCTFYKNNILVKAIDYCDLCAKNLRDPQHQPCFYNYKCVRNIKSSDIIKAIKNNFDKLSTRSNIIQTEIAESNPANKLEDFLHSKATLWCDQAFYRD